MTDTQVVGQMLHSLWEYRRRAMVILAEVALAALSYSASVYVLAPFEGQPWAWNVLESTLPILILLRFLGLLYAGVFRCPFRYASIPDLISLAKAIAASSLVFLASVLLISASGLSQVHVPGLLFFLDALLLMLLLGALHFSVRLYLTKVAMGRKNGKNVLIVGAGDAGVALLKEIALDSSATWHPVGIVDDDPQKQGATICGVPVLGRLTDLAQKAREKSAEEIFICIPSATRSQMSRILGSCREIAVPLRTLPSVTELANGKVSWRDLRKIGIEDLLQREEVHIDTTAVSQVVGGKRVLVTGAGGTIGSELCRQIAAAGPKILLLLDKSENSLFYCHLELREHYPGIQTKPFLVDVVRRDQVLEILRQERPEIVFHAAAHKHVGLLELHPQEAIRNNLLGTRNLAMAALEVHVERFVNISTDKAVNPHSYMGLSKKLTECLIREQARQNSTRFMNVRFGNVAGSTGSVLRLFWDQIQKGGPLRVTDTRATRYFMSVREAVFLIFQAAALGKGGETFIFDMGEPVNIYELAKTVSLFSGYAPGEDLPIHIMGLREGEKMHEELWEQWEQPRRTTHHKILAITGAHGGPVSILDKAEELEKYLAKNDRAGLIQFLHSIAPSFAANRQMIMPAHENGDEKSMAASASVS